METPAILTGMEIDPAKSGIKLDIDGYIKHRTVRRSAFLQYVENLCCAKGMIIMNQLHKSPTS